MPFSEGLGLWYRGPYRLKDDEAWGPLLVVDAEALTGYAVPGPVLRRQGEAVRAKGSGTSPLLELLQLGGIGSQAEPMDALYGHWSDCGDCPRCHRLEDRVLGFAQRWGVLGLAGLQWVGYRDLLPEHENGPWNQTGIPSPFQPEPVELFLYAAAVLWSWWQTYSESPSPPPARDSRWDDLLWGRPTPFRREMERVLERLYQAAPRAVPPEMTARDAAYRMTHRLMTRPTLLFAFLGRLVLGPLLNEEHAGDAWSPETIQKAMETFGAGAEQQLEQYGGDPEALLTAAVTHRRVAEAFLIQLALAATEPGLGPGWEATVTCASDQLRVQDDLRFAAVRSMTDQEARALRHPGLNEILAPVRLVVEPTSDLGSTVYDVPSLWHAIHIELYLWIVRGDAILTQCAWAKCRGPILRQARSERGHPKKFCSEACKKADQRARRVASPPSTEPSQEV